MLEVEEGFNKKDLVCPSCVLASGAGESTTVCTQHGADYVEFKCKFCCSVAVFFCWVRSWCPPPAHACIKATMPRRIAPLPLPSPPPSPHPTQ